MNTTESSHLLLASPRPKRLLLAFLIAPLAGSLGISIGMSLPLLIESGDPAMLLGGIPLITVIATPFVYFFSIVLGLPFFLLLHLSLGLSRLGLTVGWAVVGMLSFICLAGFSLPNRAEEVLLLFPFALGGAAVGYAFWAILTAKPNRPAEPGRKPVVKEKRTELAQISQEEWYGKN
jgi:hypothetical protein